MTALAPLKIVPLLLCGGVGKRLWPLSREQHPKQMLRLYNAKTLLQNTLLRLQQLPLLENPLVICNVKSRFIVQSQIEEIHAVIQNMLLESKSLNTGPAIALAALQLQQQYGDALMLVMPVDHKIDAVEKLMVSIQAAVPCALENNIVTFGVKPRTPSVHFGYIQVSMQEEQAVCPVTQFTEKPNQQTATALLQSKNAFCNTGIFLFRVSRILQDFECFHPEILQFCRQALAASSTEGKLIYVGSEFSLCPSISIDYAILEKTDRLYMATLLADWTDVGNWQLLYDMDAKDEQGNVFHGNIVSVDNKNCYVRTDQRLIAMVGMENSVVVETRDVTLIAQQDHLDKIPALVDELERHHRSEALVPATVPTPWGYYTTIENGTHFQIKKIVVHPQQRLSLQEHQYRSEHWVILKGKATIVLGYETMVLHPNQSTFVPLGVRHQIINNEEADLELIEVQMGSYLGEDDIKRFEDIYHRDKADA